jgi:cob(I)alamin adenosyltransferase
MKNQGLFIIFTGNGKGKTTAAIGQALRAAGQGLRVCIVQFIKSRKDTGEARALASFADHIEMHTIGSGFTWESKADEVRTAAEAGWKLVREKMENGRYAMLVLDEITYLLNDGFLDEKEVLTVLRARPSGMHVIITGRQASRALIDAADLVTEMKEVKHPFVSGAKALKGIEY